MKPADLGRSLVGAVLPAALAAALLLGPAAPAAAPAAASFAQKKVLGNGLTLISEEDGTSAATVIQILVKGGKRAEPAGRGGLAFLATRLAVEVPDDDKVQDLIGMASRFQVGVKGDYSVIQVECLSSELEQTLKILAKIVRNPLLSALRIDAAKKYAESQGRIDEDDSAVLGHVTALKAFSGSPGYGGSIYGDRETLGAIKGRDISDFHKRRFVCPNMVVAVSSDRPDAPGLVERAFAEFPASPAPPTEQAMLVDPEQKEMTLTRETRQVFISLVFSLPRLSRRSYALALLLENSLGKGPGSRLWPLREERRLAYTVNAVATPMMDGGIIEVYLETDRNKKTVALEGLRGVVSDLYRSGLTADDLKVARTSAWADFLRENETRTTRTLNLASFEATGLGAEFFDGLSSELEAISVEELNDYVKKVLIPVKAAVFVIGPGPAGDKNQYSD